MSETTAYGVMNLTGYRISSGSDKSGKYYFTAYPPDDSWRTFYFFAESDAERTRYVHYTVYSKITPQFLPFGLFRWIEAMQKKCSHKN